MGKVGSLYDAGSPEEQRGNTLPGMGTGIRHAGVPVAPLRRAGGLSPDSRLSGPPPVDGLLLEAAQASKFSASSATRLPDRIPAGPCCLSVDADAMDPTIMPGVIAQAPGGLTWLQIRALLHWLVRKGRVLGMDLVEIAPSFDVSGLTLVHAERLLSNFIGACVRAGYCE